MDRSLSDASKNGDVRASAKRGIAPEPAIVSSFAVSWSNVTVGSVDG